MYGSRPDVYADGAHLPFRDATFDVVVCLEVIEHVRHPESLVAEVERVLRPGARLWLSVPFLYPIHDAPHDFRRYTEYGLRQLLATGELEIVGVRRQGHSVRTAGLQMALAIAGPLQGGGLCSAAAAVPAMLLVLLTNCSAWLLSLLWPDWSAMPTVYEIEAIKR